MKTLKLAADLSLPVDVVTETIAILAKRRAGKSYTMRRIVEQLYQAGQQVVIVDPKGDQWGVRSSADGKSPGLAIIILGGERGDVPLEPSGGEVVAKLVVEERVSVLLDLSLFRKHELATFMTGFLEALYRLKAREQYRTPLMLVIDEADAVAPQKPQPNEARMLGAAEDIVRRGGQRGIGCVLVTQRSAVLNKNVLTQAQILVALRTIAPQDLAAMDAWIDVHGTVEQRKTLMSSLPSLPVGDAWVWSPGWPTAEGIFRRVHVLPISTFDSGATPKAGEKRVEPKQAADVDLEALKRQMAATIEKAKADDPKKLRADIAALQRQLAELSKSKVSAGPDPKALEQAEARGRTKGHEEALKVIGRHIGDRLELAVSEALDGASKVLASGRPPAPAPRQHRAAAAPEAPQRRSAAPAERGLDVTNPEWAALAAAQRKILNAVAFLERLGISPADKTQVSLFAGLSPTAGHTQNMYGGLRNAGLVEYPSPGVVSLTAHGRELADPGKVPQTAEEMQAMLLGRVAAAQRKLLTVLIEVYPDALDKRECSERAGLSPEAGHTQNMYGGLRSLGVIDYPQPGKVVALPVLFLQ